MPFQERTKSFGSFRLDVANQCLWRDEQRISLAPKMFSVLRYLVDNAGRLVTQDELLQNVWPETFVQPEVLRKYVLELRKVLGDQAKNATYIETLPKRGYQFVAPVTGTPSSALAPSAFSGAPLANIPPGRAGVLSELERHLGVAVTGERQMVLITGEPGIGKTTVVDAFERTLFGRDGVHVARGQCRW